MLDKEQLTNDKDRHFYTYMNFRDITCTYDRLLWRYQTYFSAMYSDLKGRKELSSLFCKVDFGVLEKLAIDGDEYDNNKA
jgi:hypothetical protein